MARVNPVPISNKRPSKIQVVCPAGLVSGGAESLHNLVVQMGRVGLNAELVYFPNFGLSGPDCLHYFEDYRLTPVELEDQRGNLIIFPEILCMQALKIQNAQAAIWWLSVDNFLRVRYDNFWDHWRYFKSALRGERPFGGVRALGQLRHFSKCRYDEIFLGEHNIAYERITGPVNTRYIEHSMSSQAAQREAKKDVILYSPETPTFIVEWVRKELPSTLLVRMHGYSIDEMIRLYTGAKVFMDFGRHPGQERMPREAALLGCCVITGLRGSASNDEDVPLPLSYKIKDTAPLEKEVFKKNLLSLVARILYNFNDCHSEQTGYRLINQNQAIFQANQIIRIFGSQNFV